MGSGELTFGHVDNLIQRDPVTACPVMHASGIKGALREHYAPSSNSALEENKWKNIFGWAPESAAEPGSPGWIKFFDARLLLLPLRASRNVFYLATSIRTMKEYCADLLNLRSDTDNNPVISQCLTNLEKFYDCCKGAEFLCYNLPDKLEIEDFSGGQSLENGQEWKTFTDIFLPGIKVEQIAIFNDELFADICSNRIPVIARNV